MNNSKKILDRIRQEDIQPVPKAYVRVRGGLIWAVFFASVLWGSAAFSVILFAIQQTDFSVLTHLSHSKVEFILGLLPVFWLLTLAIMLAVGMYSAYYSKRGYKVDMTSWAVLSVMLSILLGTLFFISGGARALDRAFASRLEVYESIQEKKLKIWMKPEDGLLAGSIESVQGDSLLQLTDFNGKTWNIAFTGAFIAPVLALEPGEKLKMQGKLIGPDHFRAEDIRPWGGPEQHLKKKQ